MCKQVNVVEDREGRQVIVIPHRDALRHYALNGLCRPAVLRKGTIYKAVLALTDLASSTNVTVCGFTLNNKGDAGSAVRMFVMTKKE